MKARFENIERSWELRQEREFNNGEEDDREPCNEDETPDIENISDDEQKYLDGR